MLCDVPRKYDVSVNIPNNWSSQYIVLKFNFFNEFDINFFLNLFSFIGRPYRRFGLKFDNHYDYFFEVVNAKT